MTAIELAHELAEYLSRRYPTTFRVSRHPESTTKCSWGWEGLPPIKTITVVPLEEKHELPLSLDDGNGVAEKAMIICALL
jgi:hypothetical protein